MTREVVVLKSVDAPKPVWPVTHLVGTCDHCGQRAPMFVVPSGELWQPYLCEPCAREVGK